MRNEETTLLLSQPIREITMDRVDQQYIARVRWYLEQELRCLMTPLSDQRGYLIRFPSGTVEETYQGESTQWTHRTTIRFSSGVTLTKYVTSPLNPTQRSQTMLAIPNTVLDGPEPPTNRQEFG